MSDAWLAAWDALRGELVPSSADAASAVRVVVRLAVAMLLGATVGIQREWEGKVAGLRTYMLTALGAAVFMLVIIETGPAPGDLGRVMQGIIPGIGFIGAGVILKRESSGRIRGITTAAGIWLTAALGCAAGAGRYGLGVLGALLALVVLSVLQRIERHVETAKRAGRQKP